MKSLFIYILTFDTGQIVTATGRLDAALAEALTLLRPRMLVTVVTTGPQLAAPSPLLTVVDASDDFPTAWNTHASHATRRWNRASSLSS